LRPTVIQEDYAVEVPTELWTSLRVAWLIQRRFDLRNHLAYVKSPVARLRLLTPEAQATH
jgi:hypothetical protein